MKRRREHLGHDVGRIGPALPQPLGFAQPAAARDVRVTAIRGVIAEGARWELVWAGPDNADGIVGTLDGGLLFAQEQPHRVSKLDTDGKVSVYVEDTHGAGALALDAKGRVFAVQRTCTDPGARVACTERTMVGIIHPEQERKSLADSFQRRLLGRLDDLVVGRNGGVYFTSSGSDSYYISPGGQMTSVGEKLRTNGIMLSPDEKTLYVTNGPMVLAFDVQTDGSVRNQRDFAKLPAGGAGYGLAVDARGRLYVTSPRGVQVFTSNGRSLGLIPTPRDAISVAFSGPDKKTLYVVGSGALGPDGRELITPPTVPNNAKSIFKIPMLAEGFKGRAK